jgi:hypothetical protein
VKRQCQSALITKSEVSDAFLFFVLFSFLAAFTTFLEAFVSSCALISSLAFFSSSLATLST